MKELICFGAHADDIEFGCMGTVIKLMREGWHARFVILTNGENGFKMGRAAPEERVRIRKEEQLEVGRRLGLEEVLFLDYPDGFLVYSDDLRRRIVEVIKEHKPDRVFCFDPANREFDNLNLFHRDHRVEEIYFFGSYRPNLHIDVGDVIDAKLELLACHRSQFPDFGRVAKLVRERMSKMSDEYEYAESFRVLRVEQLT